PDVRAAGGRGPRPDAQGCAGEGEARTGRAAVAAAHEGGERARLEAVALGPAVHDDLGRVNAVAMTQRLRISELARGPGGPGERVLPAEPVPVVDLEGEREHVRPTGDRPDIGLSRRACRAALTLEQFDHRGVSRVG